MVLGPAPPVQTLQPGSEQHDHGAGDDEPRDDGGEDRLGQDDEQAGADRTPTSPAAPKRMMRARMPVSSARAEPTPPRAIPLSAAVLVALAARGDSPTASRAGYDTTDARPAP